MKNIFKSANSLCILLLIVTTSACSRVTIKPLGGDKLNSNPTCQERKNFYLGGLIGKHEVDVNEACEGSNVLQMQTVVTSNDYLMGMVTLFIYSPRTAKIWCEA